MRVWGLGFWVQDLGIWVLLVWGFWDFGGFRILGCKGLEVWAFGILGFKGLGFSCNVGGFGIFRIWGARVLLGVYKCRASGFGP